MGQLSKYFDICLGLVFSNKEPLHILYNQHMFAHGARHKEFLAVFEQVLVQEDDYSDHTLLPVPIFAPAPLHSIAQPYRPQNEKE